MEVTETKIPDVKVISPKLFGDDRGYFMETWNRKAFCEAGIDVSFVQDNHSCSQKNTLRGLHYQLENPQGKLVRVTRGEVFDVAVDLRPESPTFGHWVGQLLSEKNKRMMWVPPRFAHGFLVITATADFHYKCTDFYDPGSERTILWNDTDLDIDWNMTDAGGLLLSDKDLAGKPFKDAQLEIKKYY
jgi:dTDP-4-dehydrorhamnose 3,5-epimerase